MHAVSLIGYLPTGSITCFEDPQVPTYRRFHACMKKILEPLRSAGTYGVKMTCADGVTRRIFPILAAYIADHPELCLVVCCKQNRCPICTVPFNSRGELATSPLRSQSLTLQVLYNQAHGQQPREYKDWGLHAVFSPFWAGMPLCDISLCIPPEILHQIWIGVFHSHLLQWCITLAGPDTIDERFKALPRFSGLKHFKKGISTVSQWTGAEHKAMFRTLLGVVAGAVDPMVLRAVRALLDFFAYALFQSHTSDTLSRMRQSLEDFHSAKDVLIELGVRRHFNIPKLHSLVHYVDGIKRLGTADNFNSENTERLHIDYAKRAYKASNRRDYVNQMAQWIQRQEAIALNEAFLEWTRGHTWPASESPRTYTIAQRPVGSLSTSCLVDSYGAPDFLEALHSFLRHSVADFTPPTTQDQFDHYNEVSIHWPATPYASDVVYRVQASPGRSNGPRHQNTTPRFDTVLVADNGRSLASEGLQGTFMIEMC
jgi:Plavaka transposase